MNKLLILFVHISCVLLIISPSVLAKSDMDEDVQIIPLHSVGMVDVLATGEKNIDVKYNVVDSDLYVECFVNGFHYSDHKVGMQHKDGEGHLRVYVDNEHVGTVYQAAFIVKGLSSGEHDIQVMVVKNDKIPYELEDSIKIDIP